MNKIALYVIAGLSVAAATTLRPATAAATDLPPGTVIAGIWKVHANNTTLFLQVESQGGDGSGCTPITGFMYPLTGANQFNTDKVRGYYCLATGQTSFLRMNWFNGETKQVYDGTFGENGLLSGSFAAFNGGDDNGEFPFSGTFWHQ